MDDQEKMTKTIIEPNAVEEKFCKILDGMRPDIPLNRDQFQIFIILMDIDKDKLEELYNSNGNPMLQLIRGRLEALTYDIDKKTQIMLSFITHTPGDAVMYIYYLAYKAKQRNKDIITFDDFIVIFPMGYFSKKQLDEAWDAQKIEGQNLLDYPEASISLNK
jgi:hypothetical protein